MSAERIFQPSRPAGAPGKFRLPYAWLPEAELEARASAPTTVGCLWCDWRVSGRWEDVSAEQRAHRREHSRKAGR